MEKLRELLDIQFAQDYCCTADEVRAGQNVFTVFEDREGRRKFQDSPFLQLACIRGKLLATGDAAFMPRLREELADADAAWLMDADGLRRLDGLLARYGRRIAMTHVFFIADETTQPKKPDGDVRWFFDGEVERFRGDARFDEAFAFRPGCPDIIGVSLERGGRLLGMAGASRDSERMYQIGIDVLPEARRQGIGTYLVTILKNEILRRGVLPYYGTAQSHIASLGVAVAAGFTPAWAELYTQTIG